MEEKNESWWVRSPWSILRKWTLTIVPYYCFWSPVVPDRYTSKLFLYAPKHITSTPQRSLLCCTDSFMSMGFHCAFTELVLMSFPPKLSFLYTNTTKLTILIFWIDTKISCFSAVPYVLTVQINLEELLSDLEPGNDVTVLLHFLSL